MTRLINCVECESETMNVSLVCDACAPDYADLPRDWPLVGDECPCPSCQSDLADIVPCRRG